MATVIRTSCQAAHRHSAIGALTALMLVLGACGSDDSEPSPASATTDSDDETTDDGELTQISIVAPAPTVIPFYPVYVADHQGFFEEEGLDVTINTVEGTDPVVQALASGQVEIGEIVTSTILIAGTSRDDFDPVMFHLDYGKSPFDVVVESDSDVEEPADLEGMTIGVGTPEGAERVTAQALMGTAGLQEGEDYEFLVVGDAGQAIAAFDRGDIDAYAGGIGDLSVLRARGLDLRSISSDQFRSRTGIGLVALQSYVDENPEILEAISRAATRGYEFIGDDAEKLVEITGEISPPQVEERDVALVLAETAIELRELEQGDTVGMNDPEQWQRWWGTLVEQGAIDESATDKTVEDFYTNEYVAQ